MVKQVPAQDPLQDHHLNVNQRLREILLKFLNKMDGSVNTFERNVWHLS